MLTTLSDEIRSARLASGASQHAVAAAAHMSTAKVSRAEAAKLRSLTIADAVLLADAVGLEISFKTYPGRGPIRDAAHAKTLHGFLAHVGAPLRYRLEMPLPPREGAFEQRAWDALLFGGDTETGVELEMRLYDLQGQTRRILLKWRDSGAERLLLLIKDTQSNRGVLLAYPDYLIGLPRLKRALVISALKSGYHPPTGYLLI